jgi:ATP-dependent DNA helicase RecG
LLRFADLVADQDLVVLAQDAADRLLRDDGDAAERHLARWMAGREEFLKT